MVSKGRRDFPEPPGPVMTVNFPSGRSTSTPLRLFWRAPRISTHPRSAGAVTHFFSATFEPTGDNSRWQTDSQIGLNFKPSYEGVALFQQFIRHHAAERTKKLFMLVQFLLPLRMINLEKFGNAFVIDVQLSQIEIMQTGQPADWRFDGAAVAFATVDGPLEHTHIVTEPGPEKLPVHVFAEPVHVENKRRIGEPLADVQPVPEIIADGIATQWQHRHRITPDLTNRSRRRCGRFR